MPPITVRDIREKEKADQRRDFEPYHPDIPAVIKSLGGNTRPPSQPVMTWVSMYNQPESMVLVHNATVMDVAETPVWIGPETKPPYRLEIKGLYYGGLSQSSSHEASGLQVGEHAKTHQYPSEVAPGPDAMLVFQPALQPLKMTGNGANLIVTVQPHLYTRNGRPVKFPGGNLNLTSSVPSVASTKRRVLVYLDEETNTLTVVNGTTVPTGGALTPSYPDLPVGGRSSGFVTLTNGQTTITTATQIEDWRDILRGRTSVGSSVTMSPNLKNFTLDVDTQLTASGTVILDYLDGNVHDITLVGNTTLVFINPPSTGRYGELKIIIHQDSTGGRTLAWPVEVWWPGATTPTVSSAAEAVDLYEAITVNGGYYYLGRALAAYGPSPISLTMSTLILAGSAVSNSVSPGATSITMNTATITGTAETITVVPGATTITVNVLTLSGTAEFITVV